MKALWVVAIIMLVTTIGVCVGLGLSPKPLPFIEPVAICYGYGEQHGQPCRDVFREQNI